MLFNSIEFLLFLPVTFLLYWFVFKALRWQNMFLVAASYLFYGWWDYRFLLLIVLTTLSSYAGGLLIGHYEGRRGRQKAVCVANVVLNVGILAVVKYYGFFSDNLQALLRLAGLHPDWPTLNILLPVGISFYTFQALSYSIDVYRGTIRPCRDVGAFFAYISFFPQLVAGPIERATDLLPQFQRSRTFRYAEAVDGCRQMLWGFFKKVVVADNCAVAVNMIWDNYTQESGLTLLLGGLLFTFQIYGDFSGYSDIAIGTAKLFGVSLMRNFNFPYFSRDIAEFWRRWHISLTTWFRDYIYIPLGGSRCSRWKVMRNTLIIFLVSGFWHGANWTFILWGAYHACLFFPLMLMGVNRKYTGPVAEGRLLPSLKEAAQMLATFLLVVVGWIIFRSESVEQAGDFLLQICSPSILYFSSFPGKKALVFVFFMLVAEWVQRDRRHALQIDNRGLLGKRWARIAFYYLFVMLILAFAGVQADFIYFQF